MIYSSAKTIELYDTIKIISIIKTNNRVMMITWLCAAVFFQRQDQKFQFTIDNFLKQYL